MQILLVLTCISVVILARFGTLLGYLCDVDSICKLRTNRQLCEVREKSCEGSYKVEDSPGFIDTTEVESGIKGIQGRFKLLTGKANRPYCDRLTTESYSSNGHTNYRLALQLEGIQANFTLSIYYPDYRQWENTSTVNVSDLWEDITIAFVLKYDLFQLVLEACVDNQTSYVAMDNVLLKQLTSDGDYVEACPWHMFLCGDNSCISKEKLCDLRMDCTDGKDEDNKTCGSIPEGAICTFDNGLCGWHNIDGTDHFDWTWHKGSTPTFNTGPTYDHTSGNGHYLYIEANKKGLAHFAVLESPVFELSPLHEFEKCQIRFHYHMFGRYISFLKLKMINEDKNKACKEEKDYLWSDSKSQGDQWLFAAVDLINMTSRYKFHFIAYAGYKEQGDIAIDDISLSPACFGKQCGGVLNSTSGKIKSPDEDHDGRYDRNLDCRWKILVEENKIIRLTIEETDIEKHTTCDYDYLQIIDGADTEDPSLGKFCGQTRQTVLRSTSNVLTVRFYTDSTINHSGFNITYITEDGKKNITQNKTVYSFDSCGAHGQNGPTQFKCNSAYKSTSVKVAVVTNGTLKGTQIWTVPENGTYLVSAAGARGGRGIKAPVASGGGFVEAKFNFTEGEKIYIVVGHPGTDTCSTNANEEIKDICQKGLPDNDEDYLNKSGWGGGGGGGATYVFKFDVQKGNFMPLIVAGGGGGQGYKSTSNKKLHRTIDHQNVTGNSGFTFPNGAGGGGGWNGSTLYPQTGRSVLEGAIGGISCNGSFSTSTPGGFGGGGGACLFGSGGGGYTGGNASTEADTPGYGGSIFYHTESLDPSFMLDLYPLTEAFVEIKLLLSCPCEYWCNITDWEKPLYFCLCPKEQVLSADGYGCEDIHVTLQPSVVEEVTDVKYIIAISVSVTMLFLILTAARICYVRQQKKKYSGKLVRLELNSTPTHGYAINTSTASTMLPTTILHSTRMIAEYNPNYDFVAAHCSEQKMNEINRDNLALIRALGQGAFGEVYKGLLSGIPNIHVTLPVAVKTLPALSTEQAELDFLMEAVIMSKFHHPNIVKFIGVCFECHPRFIVLELLEGGDLKTFLREMRPKPSSDKEILITPLTCLDLLKISIDIAKGCQHLEEKHFIHRDIAARNCLLTCKGPNRICKIADFGMTKDIYRSDYYKKGGKAMLPIKWMPPEAFLDGLFSTKTDVWSFGILLWEIFSMGYMPYPGRTNHDVMQYVTSGGRLEAPDQCPTVIYQLMSFCWAAIPETRPTFSEILERLESSKEMPEVISAKIPTFYQVPKIPIISQENVIQPLDDIENQDIEHCHQFIQDSESKEPLLPNEEDENNHEKTCNEHFISDYHVNFNVDNLDSDSGDNSVSLESHDSLLANQGPALTDAVIQCNVNQEES